MVLSIKNITFPKIESPDLKKRINENKNIFTIRVSNEQGKYAKGEILKSNLGELEVVSVKTISNINSYKYIKELKSSQISLLKNYKLLDILKLRKSSMQFFTYYQKKKKKTINVEVCDTFWKKFSGLMFRKDSPPLLFPFKKNQRLSIHSFFCKPFRAIWLNDKKQITKEILINKWLPSISGYGKYLLEIQVKNKNSHSRGGKSSSGNNSV